MRAQVGHQVAGGLATAGQLELHDVDASLEQPTHVRRVGLLLLGVGPQLTQVVHAERGQVVGLAQQAVDPAIVRP